MTWQKYNDNAPHRKVLSATFGIWFSSRFSEVFKKIRDYLFQTKCFFRKFRITVISYSQWNALHKKWGFPLRISSVNVTKSDLAIFTEEILDGKLHSLCSDVSIVGFLFLFLSFELFREMWWILMKHLIFEV